jgi:hypothetical protein
VDVLLGYDDYHFCHDLVDEFELGMAGRRGDLFKGDALRDFIDLFGGLASKKEKFRNFRGSFNDRGCLHGPFSDLGFRNLLSYLPRKHAR